MEKSSDKDPLFSNSYKCADFIWGQSLGEGKFKFCKYIFFVIYHELLINLFNVQAPSVTSNSHHSKRTKLKNLLLKP